MIISILLVDDQLSGFSGSSGPSQSTILGSIDCRLASTVPSWASPSTFSAAGLVWWVVAAGMLDELVSSPILSRLSVTPG